MFASIPNRADTCARGSRIPAEFVGRPDSATGWCDVASNLWGKLDSGLVFVVGVGYDEHMFDLMTRDAKPVSGVRSGVRSGVSSVVLSPDDMAALDSLDVPDLVDARGVMDAMLDARKAVKRATVTEFR